MQIPLPDDDPDQSPKRPIQRPAPSTVPPSRIHRFAALLQDSSTETRAVPPGLRFDRPQATPPRPHLAISAHRVWTEILNAAISDEADTSLIHDLAELHPQVASTILRTVNAAQGGISRPVHEVGLAIELLGLRRLRRLATEQQEHTSPPAVTSVSIDP